MNFEELLSYLNENIFLKEFTFSKNIFTPANKSEHELADNLIFLENFIFIYQCKERQSNSNVINNDVEKRWFENKILKKATRQIRDAISYFKRYSPIRLKNHRGHEFKINLDNRKIFKIVSYDNQNLPIDCMRINYYKSKHVGFIHILPIDIYFKIINTLYTPCEISEYFKFREKVILNNLSNDYFVDELSLLGQYLSGRLEDKPSKNYIKYFICFKNNFEEFNLNPLLLKFGDRIYDSSGDNKDYYSILTEFSKLNRVYLKQIKGRVDYCLEKLFRDEIIIPTRVYNPETCCGFVMMALPNSMIKRKREYLKNTTIAAKYNLNYKNEIGILFVKDGNDIIIDWCLIIGPNEKNEKLEKILKENNPFREVDIKKVSRYNFNH